MKNFLDSLDLLQKGEVGYVLLQVDKRGGYFLNYLLSRRLRPAMCCSKDLTPKPLVFLLFRAPSSLTGVDASSLSLQSCGEPRLLLSDLYCQWPVWTENQWRNTKYKRDYNNKLVTSKINTLKAAIMTILHYNWIT